MFEDEVTNLHQIVLSDKAHSWSNGYVIKQIFVFEELKIGSFL